MPSLKRILKKITPSSLRKPAYTVLKYARIVRYKSDMRLFPHKTTFFCPCCNMRFRSFNGWEYKGRTDEFNPVRYQNTRQDVLCPICRSLPRHRILALWCDGHKEILKSSRILYFAPENSMMLWMQRNGISCTTADLYAKADLKLDIQNTGLRDDSYEVIIANHVLEHVDDFRKALVEMKRILKPGGLFICSFPMDPNVELLDEEDEPLSEKERIRRFGQFDHKRVFGIGADQFLREAGFVVEIIDKKDYPDEILPIVSPADYDMNRLFSCRDNG